MSRAADLLQRIQKGGVARIQEMIANRETEELFLDYKRSADRGAGGSLDNRDRANLAKAVSGFGNSEGGLVIWGVDCRNDRQLGDVPTEEVPILNPVRFKSWLEQATTGTTVPPHDGVQHEAVLMPQGQEGFVVSYVPRGNSAPYQTVPELRYLMRSGSNFTPVPHGVLAGMFGRRPQPNVFFMYTLEQKFETVTEAAHYKFGITLHNKGPGIAEDAFLNIEVLELGGPHNQILIESDHRGVWNCTTYLSRMWNYMLKRDFRLSPEATSVPAIVEIVFRPPFAGEFRVRLLTGADGAVPHRSEWRVSADELAHLFYGVVGAADRGQIREANLALIERVLRHGGMKERDGA